MRTTDPAATPARSAEFPPPIGDIDAIRSLWMLDPSIRFLNHGSFGARLHSVFEAQQEWRRRFEARPVEVIDREARETLLPRTKAAIGDFLGMRPDDFGLVTNATEAVNAVLRSLDLQPGDELLTTDHVYNAVRQTMKHLAGKAGATYVEAPVARNPQSPGEIVEALTSAMTDRTRLLVIDHITSPTALIFPVHEIVRECETRGVDVLIDGAHAPGMLDLDVESIGAAWYAGNLHKWVCAPPGAGFLWARPDRQDDLHPTVISHHLGEGFAAEFAWQGTRDISAWLAVPDAINAMNELGGRGGWARIREHNHAMTCAVRTLLRNALELDDADLPPASMLGSIVSFPLPMDALKQRFPQPEDVQRALREQHQIEIPIFDWGGQWLVRPSAQIYNDPSQYQALAAALTELAGRG